VGILAVAGDLHVTFRELAAGFFVLSGIVLVLAGIVLAIGIGAFGTAIL
jgi:hypothetical protein